MKLEMDDGNQTGTVEWRGPGDMRFDFQDPGRERWLRSYFEQEDAFLSGPVECAEMELERRDASEQSVLRAAYKLAAYRYRVRHHSSGHQPVPTTKPKS